MEAFLGGGTGFIRIQLWRVNRGGRHQHHPQGHYYRLPLIHSRFLTRQISFTISSTIPLFPQPTPLTAKTKCSSIPSNITINQDSKKN
ncbi:hypothetical protein VIGAN_09101600 [Vigna angularis var. angularis]|uniref:Uncharacterized protein n=1 Tax=Vigna angularis var. angularis TaxID=157739 RepID=A0A0S3SX67_PHAAN|nr:hypothetical protein VIGAN_09101600 [Vigna angularis var. angularis]